MGQNKGSGRQKNFKGNASSNGEKKTSGRN